MTKFISLFLAITLLITGSGEVALPFFDAVSVQAETILSESNGAKAKGDFSAELADILSEYSEDYYAKIVIDTEENTVTTDEGEAVNLDDYGIDYSAVQSDEPLIPAVPVLEAAGEKAEITDDGTVRTESGEEVSTVPEDGKIIGETENGYAPVEVDGVYGKAPVGYLTDEQAEEFHLETQYNEKTSQIIVTNPYQTKRLVVDMKKGRTLRQKYGAVKWITDGNGRYVLQFDAEDKTKAALSELQRNAAVANACCDEVVSASASLKNRGGATLMQSDRYKKYLSDNGKNTKITVAVVDTGVETTHEFLKGRMVTGYDVYTKKACKTDDFGHGTHVAGIVADNTPSSVKIMPVKVLDSSGNGTELAVSLGIDWAVKHKANVINMSLGGYCTNDNCPIAQSIKKAYKAGVTVVVAAGNETYDTKYCCPARYSQCITVASATINGGVSTFSNYGAAVDLTAPGDMIYSSFIGNSYETLSGTSMASPFAAAGAAMLLTNNAKMTPAEVKSKLKSCCADMCLAGWDKYSGSGLINMGILLGDSHKADTFGLSQPENLTLNYFKHSTYYMSQLEVFCSEDEHLEDATGNHNYKIASLSDRTVKTKSSNPDVAVFDGRYIVPKKAGKATVTIWIDGGKSIDIPLTVKQTQVWIDYAASKFAGGKGTKKEPYLISTPQQLAKLALDVRNGKKYKGKYFKLTKDIDLKGKMWHSIAFVRYDILSLSGFIVSESFEGIFDGGNHKIKNMYVFDDPIQRSWGDNNAVNQAWYVGLSGLFGDMENCTVKNVGLENAYTSYSEAGLLADMIYQNTTVQNCYTTGRSAGYGLANGVWNANIRIKNCYSSATVLGGGMFGSLYSSSSDGGVVVSNCFFCGEQMGSDNVSDNGAFVAGAIESQKKKQATKLYNCFAATHALTNVGFAKKNVYSRLYKCYYLTSNKYGIKSNNNKKYTGLKANNTAFFKKKATYTNAKNWNKNYQWDFKNTWAIDKNINGGYPYLKKNKPLKTNAVNTNTGTWMDYAAAGFAGGTGTKSNPYLISNGAQLARISLLFRHGGAKGVYFKLTNDISLKAHPWFTIGGGEYMDSVYGSKYRRKRFYGNIDGAGHTISDMTVNGGDCVGFISDLSFGTVKNIQFKNVNISGGTDVGTVCGTQNYRSLISNCTVDGTVSAKYRGGGITGTQSNCCVIANCKISADVASETNGGGAAGYSGGEINATVFDGTVSTPNETDAGGIVAENERNNIIRNCCSFGCELTRMTGVEIISSYYTANGKGTLIRHQMGRNSDSITTDEEALLNAETYGGWDAEHDWNITDGAYPKPRWYTYQTPITALPSENWASSRAKSFAGGKGTKTSPYIIATAAQLAHIPDVISDEKMTYFRQVRDIDLGGKLWNSVYYDGGYYVYQMCYDGGGHTIKHLTMKNGQGLFPIAVQNSTIANIKLVDVYGYAQSGLLANCFTGSRVVNCSVTGTLYPPYGWDNASEQMSGAVVGINYGIVENCSFSGSLYHCAGIVGDNEGTVRNCHSSGAALHGSDGIVAYNTFGTVENAYTVMKGSSRIEGAQGVLNCFSAADMCLYDYSDYEVESSLIKLSANLKNQATFKDWDFDKVWTINEDANSGLPYLRTPQEYKINYVTNGGTLPKYADDRYMTGFAHGLSAASKSGYILEGWYRDKALTQKVTMIGAKDTGDVTLYAKWSPAYSVKFAANGGKGSMPNQLIARDNTVKLSANAFKKTGYLFTGWAKSKNGKVVYKNKQSVKNLAGKGKTVTLYAQWKPITYQVEFCWAKSADFHVYGMNRQRFTYNQSKKLRKCTIRGPKGKKFKGWALTPNGPVKYKDGQKVKNLTAQNKKVVVLYAKYG